MNQFPTDIVNALVKKQDIAEVFRSHLETAINTLQAENPYIFTFYHFPKPIWKSIYSTNLIESFNKQIKK